MSSIKLFDASDPIWKDNILLHILSFFDIRSLCQMRTLCTMFDEVLRKVLVCDRFRPPMPFKLLSYFRFQSLKVNSKEGMTNFFENLGDNNFVERVIVAYPFEDHTGFALQTLSQKKLRELHLYDCSNLTTFRWIESFLKRTPSLRHLSIWNVHNRRSNLPDVLAKSNRFEERIQIDMLQLSQVSFRRKAWIKVFASMDVSQLIITDQAGIIDQKSMENVTKGLSKNKFIKSFELKWINIGDQGWLKSLSSCLTKNKSLEKLQLCLTKMNDEGFSHLEKGLYSNNTLATLNISGNPISSKTLYMISRLIKIKSNIKHVNIQFNERPSENKITLVKSILDLIHSSTQSEGIESLNCVPFFVSQTERISLSQYLRFAMEMNKIKKENDMLRKRNRFLEENFSSSGKYSDDEEEEESFSYANKLQRLKLVVDKKKTLFGKERQEEEIVLREEGNSRSGWKKE